METTQEKQRVTHTFKSIKIEKPDPEYDKQAMDWLEATDSTLEITFSYTGRYFPDDKEDRDIYEVSLRHGQGIAYTFRFGQSIAHSHPKSPRWKWMSPRERSKLLDQRRQPSAYSILACLDGYSPGTFEEFCANFGYDTDSRRSEKTWKACVDQYLNLVNRYSPDELAALSEIQ